MELHHHSCVLPSNAPALSEPDSSIPSRVLQERSANKRHGYPEGSTSWKPPSSPTENIYSRQLGSYFAGNIATQLSGEKSEAQIEHETRRLMALLRRCEKYQKYRDRQPQTAKEKEHRWPDYLEEAFFRGLVRWPPMGRRKQMLDGQLRGRNELVANSIERDTGEERTRKQVSSHIQVLKNMLQDQPQILVYMSTADMGARRSRHSSSHLSHLRSRHYSSSHSSKYDYAQGGSSMYQGFGQLPSSLALAKIQSGHDDPPYTVSLFEVFVGVSNRRAHDFTQLAGNARLSDLNVTDTTSWHKQYPELNFHRTDDLKDRQVLVCDASIKVMTAERPADAALSINFDLRSQVDLSVYDALETRTRFYESGKLADQWDGRVKVGKETRTNCEYYREHGLMRVKFGSGFWAHQMQRLGHMLQTAHAQEEQTARSRIEALVRRDLQYMTAAQDIYGIRDGEAKCFLTILWRFSQTRNSHEAGRMTWRVVNFGAGRERRWCKEEELEEIRNAEALQQVVSSTASAAVCLPTSASSIYPSLPLEYHHQPFGQHNPPPPLDLDTLAMESIGAADFSVPNSATAPSLATDYSQAHSLPSLSHSQDTAVSHQSQPFHDPNDFDFNGGHITISGCLEPAINLGAYEAYSHAQHPISLHAIAGLEHDPHADPSFSDLAMAVSMPPGCYATKPSWHHANLISHLESAAEQYGDFVGHAPTSHAGDLAGHGVLHDGQMGVGGLWKLQSAFGEDTGVGADRRDEGEERYRGY